MKRFVQFVILSLVAFAPRVAVSAESQSGAARLSATGLAYEVSGRGPTVVLIHETSLDRRMWAHEAEWLSRDFRVVRYDVRGMGETPVPTAAYSNHGDLEDLLDELGETEVDLIGISGGAQIAMDFAVESPDRVRRLVLVSPVVVGNRPRGIPTFFRDIGRAVQRGDFDGANEALIASPMMEVPDELQAQVRAMVEDNTEFWGIPPGLTTPLTPPVVRRLGSIEPPTLVLFGEDDFPLVEDSAQNLDDEIPDSVVVGIPGGTHLLNLSSPDAFEQAVRNFLGVGEK